MRIEAPNHGVGILDSNLFGGIFARGGMAAIMGDEAFESNMVVAEVALARVEARLGLIPVSAAAEIETVCQPGSTDRKQLRSDCEVTGLPVWGLTRQLSRLAGPDSGRFVHWGLNTHDIMDMARALQMKKGFELIQKQINVIRTSLVELCKRHRETVMVARTHLQHALPTTFGYRVAVWLSALDRHCDRLTELLPRALMIQVGGASGSLASFGPAEEGILHPGILVMEALAQELGLHNSIIAWHAARDGLTEVASWLAMVSGSVAKIATDVRTAFELACCC
jgi:3-carboxy-cis,cis-muconate cycloisomerase